MGDTTVIVKGCGDDRFGKALEILCSRPHAVSKRIVGATIQSQHTGGGALKPDFSGGDVSFRRKVIHKEKDSRGKCKITYESASFTREANGCLKFVLITEPSSQLQSTPCSFSITKSDDKIVFTALDKENSLKSIEEAKKSFNAVVKWCREDSLTVSDPALRLVDLEKYQTKYDELKAKYGQHLIEVR